MQRTDYEKKFVPVIESKDYGSVGIDGASVNMGLIQRICFSLLFGALTGNSVLKFYAGATKGTKTTALAFNYRLSSAAYKVALADGLGSEVAVASTGLTLTAATYQHQQLVVDFENVDLPDGKQWLTLEIDATATVMNVACLGIGSPFYGGASGPTVID